MKLSMDLHPSWIKVLIVIFLIAGTQIGYTDFSYILYQLLWVPFSYFLNFQPFEDPKRSYSTTMYGIVFAAVVWSGIIYLLLSVRLKKRDRQDKRTHKQT